MYVLGDTNSDENTLEGHKDIRRYKAAVDTLESRVTFCFTSHTFMTVIRTIIQ